MYRVRYYQELIHPDHFRGMGLFGVLIRSLNWIRWKLETFVQRLVLRTIAKRGGIGRERTRDLLKTFELDVAQERIEKEMTSPVREPVTENWGAAQRSDRYIEGRQRSALDATVTDEKGGIPDRPRRLDNLIGAYGFNLRAKKYARGLRFQTLDPEGDFEPLSEETGDGHDKRDGRNEVGVGARGSGSVGGGVPRAVDGHHSSLEGARRVE